MTEQAGWRRVDAAEAQVLLQKDLLIFDVRDPAAFAAGRIEDARHLSDANLERTLFGTPRSQPILIYCYHGNASQTYAQIFRDFGFTAVHDLIGGYEAWRAAVPVPDSRGLDPILRRWLSDNGFPPDDLEAKRDHRMTPLMHACRLGDEVMVTALLAAGAALEPLNSDGNNALWLACYSGNLAIIDRLLARGIAIDHQNDNGATCLMYAASTGKTAVVARLLAAGADPELKTVDDFTALDMAANLDCLNLLRAAAHY
jgi:thiosulfate/3-mercaptopyruvate sulfurtransferase